MSILSGFKKIKKYEANDAGNHQLVSEWTSASTVEMANGNTAETEIGEIKSDMGNIRFSITENNLLHVERKE